jgi:hypothetical protein
MAARVGSVGAGRLETELDKAPNCWQMAQILIRQRLRRYCAYLSGSPNPSGCVALWTNRLDSSRCNKGKVAEEIK